MKRTFLKQVAMAGVLAAATAVASCTMKSQEAPPLTGPSEFGTSIVVTVTPDTIFQDGFSTSLITVTARDQNGNPSNESLRAEIRVGGVAVDFGSLSARSIVTGADGKETLTYTAPAAPAGPSVDNKTIVTIAVTPLGTDFGNSVTRQATIRLIPTGVVVPPDGLSPRFTVRPATPVDHEVVVFDASASTSPANNPIEAYEWDFGDGESGGGPMATHIYDEPDTYFVRLTITDGHGRSAATTQSLTVTEGATPTALFTFSPTDPTAPATVNFNASTSTAPLGRSIVSYTWDFGQGGTLQTTTNPLISHSYAAPGAYTVTLTVTDSTGKTSKPVPLTVTVKKPS